MADVDALEKLLLILEAELKEAKSKVSSVRARYKSVKEVVEILKDDQQPKKGGKNEKT